MEKHRLDKQLGIHKLNDEDIKYSIYLRAGYVCMHVTLLMVVWATVRHAVMGETSVVKIIKQCSKLACFSKGNSNFGSGQFLKFRQCYGV